MTTKDEIYNLLAKNESIQLVGLSGSGKSHLLREIDAIFIDASILFPIDFISLLHNFAQSVGIKTISNNATEVQDLISKKILDTKTTIIIDGFEKIIKTEFTQFFNFLKRLRDIHKPNLNYIFSVSSLAPIGHEYNKVLGDLFKLVQENILYIKPYSKSTFESDVKNDFETMIKNKINFDELYAQTGGIPALVKASIKENGLLLNSQIIEISNQIKNASIESLKKHGIADKDGKIISNLLQLNNNIKSNLTVLESLLFEVLKENIGDVITKDKICEYVYPDVKNKIGISDSSIDQLIHRLKKKLNDYNIENQHGVGYKLVLNRNW